MIEKLKHIFSLQLSKEDKYLLGLSGGSDSMALFFALLELGYHFEVCTIDHQSRAAIQEEIAFLKNLCREKGVVFHQKRVEGIAFGESNLEDKYRMKRYELFQQLYEEGQFDGLILGHHADDQIETVLKRFLEGSSIAGLSGMALKTTFEGMHLFRPLLSIRKREIILWLESKGAIWFEDETNRNERYLRARMRERILPFLRKEFGKEFEENLLHFAQKMWQVAQLILPKIPEPIRGPFTVFYPLEPTLELLEAESFVREVSKREGWALSKSEVERMGQAIASKEKGIEVVRICRRMICDRNGLFFHEDVEPIFSLEKGEGKAPGWRGVIAGKATVPIEGEGVELRLPSHLNLRLPSGVSLKKWYTQYGVPSHLRLITPVIFKEGRLIADCLSGYSFSPKGEKWVLTFNGKKNRML